MAPYGDGSDGGMLEAKKQKSDMMGGVTLSSPISKTQTLPNGPLMMPGQQQSAEITLHDVTFMELAKQLRDRTYEQKGMFKWVRKPSAEMKGIFSAMDQFDRLTKISVSTDDDGFSEQLSNMQEAYLGIITSCQHYLDTHTDPGSREGLLRKQIVEDIMKMVREESPKLEHAATFFKNADARLGYSWATVVRSSRTESFTDGQNGVKLSTVGAGTSELIVIEQGQKKSYFKEADKTPVFDVATSAKEVLASEKNTPPMREKVLRCLAKVSPSTFQEIQGYFTGNFSRGELKDELFDRNRSVLPAELCALYQDALYDPEELEEFQSTLKELGKRMNLATNSASIAHIATGNDLTMRNVLTTRFADALDMGNMVARSTFTDISVNGQQMSGVTMEEAQGISLAKLADDPKMVGKTMRYSPEAVQELSKLHLLDLICGQVDRHEGNYNVTYHVDGDDLFIDHIYAFDNDLAFGTIQGEDLTSEKQEIGLNLRRIEDRGEVKLLAVDQELAFRIVSMSEEQIRFLTCDSTLKPDEQAALISRFQAVKATLQKIIDADGKPDDPSVPESLRGRKVLMDGASDWGTFRDSLEALDENGKWNMTRYSYFMRQCNRSRIEPPKSQGGGAPQQ